MFGVLAHATAAVHVLALLYIGLGGFLGWRWPSSLAVHALFATWGIAVNVLPLNCPLTALENAFRHAQGLGDLPGGFNEYYLYGSVVPHWSLPLVAAVGIAAVAVSYLGAYQAYRHRHEAPGHRHGALHLG